MEIVGVDGDTIKRGDQVEEKDGGEIDIGKVCKGEGQVEGRVVFGQT